MPRVDVDDFKKYVTSMSAEKHAAIQEADQRRVDEEYSRFVAAYKREECYLCGKSFKTISKNDPCVHWLLRQCKFKKKDFPLIYEKFGFTQIAAFVRWVANVERWMSSINDIPEHSSDRKIFEFTVCWKNIEWTFDCSKNDYEGHGNGQSSHPHYHFQMRIDKRPFIDFGDFHVPLSDYDLFRFDMQINAGDVFYTSFGPGGVGMADALSIDPEDIIRETEVADEDLATYRMQTLIYNKEGIDGEALLKMVKESEETGETLASLSRKHLPEGQVQQTIISAADSVPEIAKRTERKRR